MKQREPSKTQSNHLPACAAEYIRGVVEKMRYRRKVRRDVQAELIAHFEDELKDCATDEDKEQKARSLIAEFGDVKLLAVLMRRAKKRCRPLWQKVLVRSLQALGIIVVYLAFSSARLFVGTPNVKVDYAAWLSDKVRQAKQESLNAKPYFDKAAELADERPYLFEILPRGHSRWPADMNDRQRQSVANLLEKNTVAFEMLKEGVEKPYYWPPYPATLFKESNAPYPLSQNLPEDVIASLTRYKKLCRLFSMRISWRAYEGDLAGAFDDSLAVMKLGHHLQGRGLLVEQLVGIAIEGLAHGRFCAVLDRTEVPADLLEQMQEELHSLFCTEEAIVNLQTEKLFWYDLVQRTFTDDGHGGGRPLKPALPLVASDWKDGLLGLVTFNYPGRREMMRTIDEFYAEMELFLKQPPWQTGAEDRRQQLEQIMGESFLLKQLAPSYRRIGKILWRMKAHRRALVCTLAVMRHNKEKGQYPTTLAEVVEAGYLDKVPMDPYSGQPLSYRRTTAGFILYSWGENLKDDGGQLGTGWDGTPKMWTDNGDWVFWPRFESQKRPSKGD